MKNTKKYKLKDLETDYLDILDTDDDALMSLKLKVKNLNFTDRALMLLYAELGSMNNVSKVLNISATTVYNNIHRIRKNIGIE